MRSLFAIARETNAKLEDTSRYFPVRESIQKIVQFFNVLLHLNLQGDDCPAWHPDVISFCDKERHLKIHFDIYLRPGKYQGGWF